MLGINKIRRRKVYCQIKIEGLGIDEMVLAYALSSKTTRRTGKDAGAAPASLKDLPQLSGWNKELVKGYTIVGPLKERHRRFGPGNLQALQHLLPRLFQKPIPIQAVSRIRRQASQTQERRSRFAFKEVVRKTSNPGDHSLSDAFPSQTERRISSPLYRQTAFH